MSSNNIIILKYRKNDINNMDNNKGKLQISAKYGADVQMYQKANGDITYFACYLNHKKRDKNGKPMRSRLKVGCKSEGVTQAFVKSISDKLAIKSRIGEDNEDIQIKVRNKFLTFQDLAEKYYVNRRKMRFITEDDENLKNDRSLFNCHLRVFADRDPNTIDEEDIIEFISQKKTEKFGSKQDKHYSLTTINNMLTHLRAILNFGINNRLITKMPLIKKLPMPDNQRERYFNKDEIKLIFEHTKLDPILDLFVKLSLSTGGRLESIRHLKVKDFNLEENIVTITDMKRETAQKNRTRYTGFYNDKIKFLIQQNIKNKSPDEYILTSDDGKLVPKSYIQNNIQELFNKLFNEDLVTDDRRHRAVLHTLRHTFGSQLIIESKADLDVAQRLMNHSDRKVTERYVKYDPKYGSMYVNKFSFLL